MSDDLQLIRARNLKWHRLVWPGGDQALVDDYNQLGADRRSLIVALDSLRSENERLRDAVKRIAEFDCHPYVECDPEAVAESNVCPECIEARRPERRWPPSGHCDKHYRSVLVARDDKQAHEEATVKYRMKDIAVEALAAHERACQEYRELNAKYVQDMRVAHPETRACVYIPPDDSVPMWLTGCGHEHHKDPDLDLYDFCPYCGRPVEEGDAPPLQDSDRPADAGGLAPIHPALASRSETPGDPLADVGPPAVKTPCRESSGKIPKEPQ